MTPLTLNAFELGSPQSTELYRLKGIPIQTNGVIRIRCFTIHGELVCNCFATMCYLKQQEVTQKIEQHKERIDLNNKSFYEMKKQKDALQNERK